MSLLLVVGLSDPYVPPPSSQQRGDDAPPRRRGPVYYQEEEPQPELLAAREEPKRVKVTRKAVKAALESTDAPVWPLSVNAAVKALPEYVSVTPEWDRVDPAALSAEIVRRLRAEFIRLQMEADEDDIELLLMAA